LAFFAYTPVSKRIGKGDPEEDKKAQEKKDQIINKLLSFVPKYSDVQKKKEWVVWYIMFNRNNTLFNTHSQKVVRCAAGYMGLTSARCRIKYKEVIVHVLVNLHDTGFVSTAVAVVRGWENCYNMFIMTPVEAVHYKLMGTWYQLKIIDMIELLRYILTEGIAGSSWRNTPPSAVIGIWPKKITHGAFMRDFLHTVKLSYLV